MRAGLLVRPGSFWVGMHWSPYNRRACINLIPCVTVWITLRGGIAPGEAADAPTELTPAEAEALFPPPAQETPQ